MMSCHQFHNVVRVHIYLYPLALYQLDRTRPCDIIHVHTCEIMEHSQIDTSGASPISLFVAYFGLRQMLILQDALQV